MAFCSYLLSNGPYKHTDKQTDKQIKQYNQNITSIAKEVITVLELDDLLPLMAINLFHNHYQQDFSLALADHLALT